MVRIVSIHIRVIGKGNLCDHNDYISFGLFDYMRTVSLNKISNRNCERNKNCLTKGVFKFFTFESLHTQKKTHRAIPQDDYITLGTIRYGIKFGSRPHSSNKSNSTTLPVSDARETLSNGYHTEHRPNEHNAQSSMGVKGASNLLENVISTKDACKARIKTPMPWLGQFDSSQMKSQGKFSYINIEYNRGAFFLLVSCSNWRLNS